MFCRWCGETNARCKCVSGTSRGSETVKALRQTDLMPSRDRWSTRYTERRLSSSPSASPTLDSFPSKSTCPSPSPLSLSDGEVMEDVLSHAFESVLAPSNELDKWKCADCQTRFPPDATVYPHQDKLFCRACFSKSYSKGNCETCTKPVLGDVPFVKQAEKLWHNICCKCTYCQTNVSSDPMTDLVGSLTCEPCFLAAAWRKKPSGNAIPSSPKPQSKSWRNTQMKQPAIEHLRGQFAAAGLQKSLPSPQAPTQASLPNQLALKDSASSSRAHPSATSDECYKCGLNLLSTASNGDKIIKLSSPKISMHARCFSCAICKKSFEQPSYVLLDDGSFAHPDCAPLIEVPANSSKVSRPIQLEPKLPRTRPLPPSSAPLSPSHTGVGNQKTAFKSVGNKCPVCHQSVTALDLSLSSGLVKWHTRCVRCITCRKQMTEVRLNAEGVNQCTLCRLSK